MQKKIVVALVTFERKKYRISSSQPCPQTLDGGAVEVLDLGTSGSQQTGSSLGLSLQEAGVRQGSRRWCCTDAVVVSYVCLLLLLKPAPGIERLHVSSHCRHPTSSRRRPCPDLIRPSKARDPSLVPPRLLHCLAILQPRLYFLALRPHARTP